MVLLDLRLAVLLLVDLFRVPLVQQEVALALLKVILFIFFAFFIVNLIQILVVLLEPVLFQR